MVTKRRHTPKTGHLIHTSLTTSVIIRNFLCILFCLYLFLSFMALKLPLLWAVGLDFSEFLFRKQIDQDNPQGNWRTLEHFVAYALGHLLCVCCYPSEDSPVAQRKRTLSPFLCKTHLPRSEIIY